MVFHRVLGCQCRRSGVSMPAAGDGFLRGHTKSRVITGGKRSGQDGNIVEPGERFKRCLRGTCVVGLGGVPTVGRSSSVARRHQRREPAQAAHSVRQTGVPTVANAPPTLVTHLVSACITLAGEARLLPVFYLLGLEIGGREREQTLSREACVPAARASRLWPSTTAGRRLKISQRTA